MTRTNLLQLLIVAIGLPIGAMLSNRSNLLHEQMEHVIPVKHNAMDHGLLEVGGEGSFPAIDDLVLSKDKMSGWNLFVKTTNFTFTPEHVNTEHRVGEGHAHVYINGEKFARIYGPYLHLPELIGDDHELSVTLNANGHEALAIDGQVIEKTITIE